MGNFERASSEQEGAMSTPENPEALAAPDFSPSTLQSLLPDENYFPKTDDFYIPPSAEHLTGCTHIQILKKISRIQDRLAKDHNLSTQYLLITDTTQIIRDELLEKRIGGARATVSGQRILFRIMPGTLHEKIVLTTAMWFPVAMQAAGIPFSSTAWVPTGTADKYGRLCGKQPDFGIVPAANYGLLLPSQYGANVHGRDLERAWPSFVMEVAYNQSHPSLVMNAHWWYNNSGRQTKLILLFNIKSTSTFSVHIELWQECLAAQIPQLQCTQSTDFSIGQDPAPITLDYVQLMRQQQIPHGRSNVIITTEILREICRPTT